MTALNIGDLAPDFTLPRDGGDTVSLSALRGAPIVVYFFPRADTKGCTIQAVDFTGLKAEFAALGAQVIGISTDPITKQDKFRDKHNLDIVLISDEAAETCADYGVWVEKSMYGKQFMGIERSTFLIDSDGKISHIWRKVKTKDHAKLVLETLRG